MVEGKIVADPRHKQKEPRSNSSHAWNELHGFGHLCPDVYWGGQHFDPDSFFNFPLLKPPFNRQNANGEGDLLTGVIFSRMHSPRTSSWRCHRVSDVCSMLFDPVRQLSPSFSDVDCWTWGAGQFVYCAFDFALSWHPAADQAILIRTFVIVKPRFYQNLFQGWRRLCHHIHLQTMFHKYSLHSDAEIVTQVR